MNNYFQDSKGNKSSKRLCGSILLLLGVCFSMVLFYFSLYKNASDPITAMNLINMFLISGEVC